MIRLRTCTFVQHQLSHLRAVSSAVHIEARSTYITLSISTYSSLKYIHIEVCKWYESFCNNFFSLALWFSGAVIQATMRSKPFSIEQVALCWSISYATKCMSCPIITNTHTLLIPFSFIYLSHFPSVWAIHSSCFTINKSYASFQTLAQLFQNIINHLKSSFDSSVSLIIRIEMIFPMAA